jgi:hypothetical protein
MKLCADLRVQIDVCALHISAARKYVAKIRFCCFVVGGKTLHNSSDEGLGQQHRKKPYVQLRLESVPPGGSKLRC